MREKVLEEITLTQYKKSLAPRRDDWHKGLSGHVLIVGGDEGFAGAPRLAAEAALRVGAGLVTVATHPKHAQTLNLTRPEIMCRGIQLGLALKGLMAKADVIVLGPGLGQSAWSKKVYKLVMASNKPMVVDADGLNLLAKTPASRNNWILTPHPGEAARLLGQSTEAIQQDRVSAVRRLQARFHGHAILKGSGTLIASTNHKPVVCKAGNPGMASAGMGDVLSGVIGGLMAQNLSLEVAAKLGVLMHATAGDLASKEGERGMLALDLMPYLRKLAN